MRQITYDILVKYKGYNGMNITLPQIGTIYLDGDDNILIKGATAGIIETVRQLSKVKVKMEIVTGWTKLDLPGLKVIHVKNEEEELKSVVKEAIQEQVADAADQAAEAPEVHEEAPAEPEVENNLTSRKEELENITFSKGPLKGKAFKEFDLETLEKRFNTLPKADKPLVEEYINILKGE